jgi:preprotein translocase subunit SecD
MQKNLKWKLILILAFMLVCAGFFVYPRETGAPLFSRIKLGLDLKGGIHLILQVVTDEALDQELRQDAERVSQELKSKNIPFASSKKGNGYSVEIAGVDSAGENEVRTYLERVYSPRYAVRSTVVEGKSNFSMVLSEPQIRKTREDTVRGARDTIRRRVDEKGITEPTLEIYGGRGEEVQDQIILELPGIDDPDSVKKLFETTAQLKLCLVKEKNGGPFDSIDKAVSDNGGSIPDEYEVLAYVGGTADHVQYAVVNKTPVITGKDLKMARRTTDSNGAAAVNFFLKSEGAKLFGDATEKHIGEQLAIILDNRVNSAPRINSKIEAEGIITGRFSVKEAEDLALLLRSGALPASLRILQEQAVGASLGNDSIKAGIIASAVGFGLVVIIMIVYYKHSGLNAIWCLLGNLIILMGFMGFSSGTMLGTTLTLPGIAGIILTIGMAVDSNILIFERIREELRGGKTVRAAIDTGFTKVFWTIFDTHITTLVSAAFLFNFGTGPIRGFAVTLFIGLIANMFTAIYVSHRLFDLMLGNRKVEGLSI